MWLIDHQMNEMASLELGEYYKRIPLRKSATIIHGNALRIDWQLLLNGGGKFNYILGNPPFVGKHLMNSEQRADLEGILNGVNGAGLLDYVTGWYIKAAEYMRDHNRNPYEANESDKLTRCAFVSTNSIAQGEQVGLLWNELYGKYKLKIHFAHRTFNWSNEAKGNAAVHVVIIGFANFEKPEKLVYEYGHVKGEPHAVKVKNINPYLVEGSDTAILPRSKPLCSVPTIINGNKPVDGGNLILDNEEKDSLLAAEPKAAPYVRMFAGSQDFLNGKTRWCLWLKDINPSLLRELPLVLERIERVKHFRLKSPKQYTRQKADFPMLFEQIRQLDTPFILIPRVSSENRRYIPIGFLGKEVIVSDTATFIPNASIYNFGIITSAMHMAWVRFVCGRLKSDFRYSNDIVYNNFPWPEMPSVKHKEDVEKAGQVILDVRAQFADATLADLYDPSTMPPALVKAHQQLDRAVDLCYRPQPFPNETKRIEFLFELYDKYTSGMFQPTKPVRRNKAG